MRRGSFGLGLVAGVFLFAWTASGAEEADWLTALEKTLKTPVSVTWKEKVVKDALDIMSGTLNVPMVIDPAVPEECLSARVSMKVKRMPAGMILSNVLAAGGLRYTFLNGAVYVSTEAGLIKKLLYESAGVAVAETGPMTVGEAVVRSSRARVEPAALGVVPFEAVVAPEPRPYVDPLTGITQFPGPEIFTDNPNLRSPRSIAERMYSRHPSFLKPEYLQQLSKRGATPEDAAYREALGRLIEIIRQHPDWTTAQVLSFVEGKGKPGKE